MSQHPVTTHWQETGTPGCRPAMPNGIINGLRSCPLPVFAFILSLFMPTDLSVYVGTLRLSPYRIVLLVMCIPSCLRILSGRTGRLILPDYLLLLFALWGFVIFAIHHGPEVALESGGVQALELLGAYGVARAYVRTTAHFIGTAVLLLTAMMFFGPLTMIESITGNHFLRTLGAAAVGTSFSSAIDTRMGLHRAFGPFDHPILYGVFAASMLGMAWSLLEHRGTRSIGLALGALGALAGTISSVSSGAAAALSTQILLCTWERLTRAVPRRWTLLIAAITAIYIVVDMLSNRSGMKALLSYLTLSQETAYARIMIFHWGMDNVRAHPILGLGFNEWERPSYMSSSMDNFWLLQAVMFGVPGFLLIAIATCTMLAMRWRRAFGSLRHLRTGWTISMIGLIVAACTVHLWNTTYVYFAFLLGIGGCFVSPPAASQDRYRLRSVPRAG